MLQVLNEPIGFIPTPPPKLLLYLIWATNSPHPKHPKRTSQTWTARSCNRSALYRSPSISSWQTFSFAKFSTRNFSQWFWNHSSNQSANQQSTLTKGRTRILKHQETTYDTSKSWRWRAPTWDAPHTLLVLHRDIVAAHTMTLGKETKA